MLEFYEVNELERKWEEYDKNRKKFSILNLKNKNSGSFFGLDKIILLSLVFIVLIVVALFWILKDNKNDITLANVNDELMDNKPVVNINGTTISHDNNVTHNVAKLEISEKSGERPTLSIKDIGINSSEDSAGFIISNNYQNSDTTNSNNFNNSGFNTQRNNQALFNNVPTNEIIDFSNAPMKPNLNSQEIKPRSTTPLSKKIEIKTSNLNNNKQSLVDKFNATNKIEYSLMLAEEAYSKSDYDGAIKWALTSNEIDKDNVQSWIIFAKANYKKGKKDDAIYALETFNAKAKSSEIDNLISQIRGGAL